MKEIFHQKYCASCLEVEELRKKLYELNLEKKALLNENQALRELKKFNNEKEDVLYIRESDVSFFVITREFTTAYNGKLISVDLKGYEYFKDRLGYSSDKSFISLHCSAKYHKNSDFLSGFFIQDFTCDELKQNQGFGSLLIDEFIKYAIQQKVKSIEGKLSWVDIGKDNDRTEQEQKNLERLIHFYTKHGFTVSGNDIRIEL